MNQCKHIISRRQMLATSGLAIAGVAGCGELSNETPGNNRTTTAVTTPQDTSAKPTRATGDTTKTQQVPENTETDTETSTPTGTKTPQSVSGTVLSRELVMIPSTTDSSSVVRTVVKNTGSAIEYVRVTVTFYGSNQNIVDSRVDALPIVEPGEVWESYVPFEGDKDDLTGFESIVSVSLSPIREIANIELLSQQLRHSNETVSITGTAKNTQSTSLLDVVANGKFYANNGHVIGYNLARIQKLSSGQSWNFTIPYPGVVGQDRISDIGVIFS